jgi:hypothetical protein
VTHLARLASLFAALALLLVVPRVAWAIEYEIFIDVDDEEELYELWNTGQISEDTFNTLVDLRRTGVDLNEADREQLYALPNLDYADVDAILAYRAEVGRILAPADLAAAGVISREKLGSILVYLRAHDSRRVKATEGWVRYQTAWSQLDRTVPPMALQAQVNTLRQLTIGGAASLTRLLPGDPVWDPNRDAPAADRLRPRVFAPKYYVKWETSRWGVIAGTYRIGFGQRLVFDNTSRYTPNGFVLDDSIRRTQDLTKRCRESAGELPESPCSGDEYYTYTTRDYRWSDGLRGVAIGAKHIEAPVGWVQLYGFGSWQPRQLYQYEFYDASVCADPLSTAEVCNAPPTYVRNDDDPLAPTPSYYAQTLPRTYDEVLGGANLSWFYDRRTHVGFTGYGANNLWRVGEADLDFRRSSVMPFGGAFGAIGADMAWGRRWSDLTFELARSFDSMSSPSDPRYGGGGWAGILRHTSTIADTHLLEVSARYYDSKYANPHAGPISQGDEFHGNRARDETGVRLLYRGRIADRVDLRSVADVWMQPTEGALKLLTYVRANVDVKPWFRPGLWLQYRNIDLNKRGVDATAVNSQLLDVDAGEDDRPEACITDSTGTTRYDCPIQSGQITARLAFRPLDKLSITAQYQHELIQDVRFPDRLRQDASTFLIIRANPVKTLRLAARVRYLNMDIADEQTYEESIWGYFDVSYVFARLVKLQLRYDAFGWLDERDYTLRRNPRVEHRLRFELEVRF